MICVNNIWYGYSKDKKIFSDFSLHIKEAESWGIVGFNGAGKSTLLKIILGIIKPQSGDVTIDNRNIYKQRKQIMNGIGVVWGQRPTLWWDVPLLESYKMLKRIYRIPEQEYEQRLSYFDELLHFSDYWKRPLRTLSLGQRVKAEIIGSLLHAPKIIIYDEPFLGLDFLTKKKIINALNIYKKDHNATMILTSHNMPDIEELCDNLLLINDGRILYKGLTDQIVSEYGEQKKIKVLYQNDQFRLSDEINNKVRIIDHTENEKYVLFNCSDISYQKVVCDLSMLNDITEIKADENALEQIIEKIIEGEKSSHE